MPPQHDPSRVTQLLDAIGAGNAQAADQLLPLVYDSLRALARAELAREAVGQTLQPTALVHEAYLRLLAQRDVAWTNPAQALGLAAQAMRRILVDHARARAALKRGAAGGRLSLEDVETPVPGGAVDLLALEEALERLGQLDADQARIVELRFYGGLTNEQVSSALQIPPRSVDRHWAVAKAWLLRELGG